MSVIWTDYPEWTQRPGSDRSSFVRKLIEGQPLCCESVTGLQAAQVADLIGRVREIVGHEWENPPVGRPHVLPLPTAVIAVLFGLRHNMPGEVFGCSQATITRYRQILQPGKPWSVN